MGINWNIIKGTWNEIKGEARKQWGKLTDDEWEQIAGEREKLYGRLQQHYGWTREEVESEVEKMFGGGRPS